MDESEYKKRSNLLKSKPWWTNLHLTLEQNLLKRFPNTLVVAHMSKEIFIYKNVIESETYKIYSNPKIKMELMEPGNCHDNVDQLYEENKIDKICYGYALGNGTDDKTLWREHSWGMIDDTIIETTVPRFAYVHLNCFKL